MANYNAKKYVESTDFERVQSLYRKAQDKVYTDTMVKVLKMKAAKEGMRKVLAEEMGIPEGSSHYAVLEEYDDLMEGQGWGKLSAKDTVALFVTLSPEPDSAEPQQMLDSFEKMFGRPKKGISASLWCIEQSGTIAKGNVGYHPHVHAVVMLDKSTQSGERGKVKAMIERNLKKYKTKSDAYLQIKAISEKSLDSKIAYVCGKKTEKSKQPQVDADKVWREENGYLPEYNGYVDK